YRTVVELAPRSDRRVRAWSANIAAAAEPVEFRLGDEARTQTWIDYPQGITAALRETGHTIGGVDPRIESDVPVGRGLSSSAALLVSLLRGLRTLFSLTLDDLQLARVAHKAENDLVGAPVGIMDQLVSSLGRPGHALFIDARTLDVEHIPLPPALEVA